MAMVQETATTGESVGTEGGCRHYWVIESETGPISKGRCKVCYLQKDFKNYIRDCLRADGEGCLERLIWQGRERMEGIIDLQIEDLSGINEAEE